MDRGELSATSIRDLGDLFMDTLEQAAPALLSTDLDGIERHLQVVMRGVMGRVVEAVIGTIAATQADVQPTCLTCGRRVRLVEHQRPRDLFGLLGDYTVCRPYFICDPCERGRIPADERLGIGSGTLSPGLARVVCRVGIENAFGEDADVLEETLSLDVPREDIRRMTEGIGAVVEAEQQALIAAARQGEAPDQEPGEPTPTILAVEVDGIMVHTDGDWHEAKVGTVAPLGPTCEVDTETGRERLCWGRSSYCVGLEPADDFWFRVYVEACRRGLGSADLHTVVALGDGAEWIWNGASRFLGINDVEVVEIVDFYHAAEHLWTVANAVYGAGTSRASAWTEPLKRRLLTEGAEPVITALHALTAGQQESVEHEVVAVGTDDEGGGSAAAEEVRKAIGYFTTHAARMAYPTFVARRLPIGSGAVESAGKLVVGQREKGPGMRWTREGAQAVANLRALHRSGRWRTFWGAQPQRRRPKVSARKPASLAA